MGRDGGRRAFLAVLFACLGLLVLNYASRSVDFQMANEHRYPRKNQNLSLAQADGIVTIEGKGILYGSDLKALLRNEGMREQDVTDIIVGAGVVEIGYDVFNDFDELITLKLGNAVERVAAGGLRRCPKLRYLYLPAGLKDIGLDFLYECDQCRVVTQGQASELPPMANVGDDRILDGVDSPEALKAVVSEALPAAVTRWWPAEGE